MKRTTNPETDETLIMFCTCRLMEYIAVMTKCTSNHIIIIKCSVTVLIPTSLKQATLYACIPLYKPWQVFYPCICYKDYSFWAEYRLQQQFLNFVPSWPSTSSVPRHNPMFPVTHKALLEPLGAKGSAKGLERWLDAQRRINHPQWIILWPGVSQALYYHTSHGNRK